MTGLHDDRWTDCSLPSSMGTIEDNGAAGAPCPVRRNGLFRQGGAVPSMNVASLNEPVGLSALSADRPCPNCAKGAVEILPEYSRDGWLIVSCEGCGFVYLRNPPDYADLDGQFAWEVSFGAERESRMNRASVLRRWNHAFRHRRAFRTRERRHRKLVDLLGSGKVLDIGCGAGHRLHAPFIPFGIEISAALHAKADAHMRSLGGKCLHAAGAEGVWRFDEGMFDGVVMHSYLEHEFDPVKSLRGAHRALRPSGRVFVRVPNFGSLGRRVRGREWCGFRYPDHVNYFTMSTLCAVAAKAGFTVRPLNRTRLWVDDNIHALLVKPEA